MARLAVVYMATPCASVPAPSNVVPSRKLTEPVGVPEGEVTVAMKVTELVESTGFTEAASAIDGVILETWNCMVTAVATAA